MGKLVVQKKIGRDNLILETGQLAKQADSAIVVRYGDTMVLTAMTTAPQDRLDFLPLTCDYRERTSAAGKFPGGFLKREGRPTIKETLSSRLMDRPLRPMFPKNFRDEVQVQAMVLSSDRLNDPDVFAMNGAAAACWISSLPFEGPIGHVRVGRVDGKLVCFPSQVDLEYSDLDLIISANEKYVLMIEGFAREMPEADMYEAIQYGFDRCVEVCQLQRELFEQVRPEKTAYPEDQGSPFADQLNRRYAGDMRKAKTTGTKQERAAAVRALREKAFADLVPNEEDRVAQKSAFKDAFHDLEEKVVRQMLMDGQRADGRGPEDVRQIDCEVDILPKTHGSSLFQRGETQALISVTLGTSRDEQRVDGLFDEISKKFMLDYNFPSFSVGEVKPIRGPGRREIGHGMLAERSVKPILPDVEQFPYTVRVISEILESNGSSSMATVCGATLGLMSAGVPISAPVAGISIGLVKESDRDWTLLTDILGDEDHFGDMDFKIAGTPTGITGIQLDLKVRGITFDIIEATLAQARRARRSILRKMLAAINEPRQDIAEHAPRLRRLKIDVDKIGLLIGPGGRNIRSIQEQTGAVIEVEDDGSVLIAATDKEAADAATARVEAVTATVKVGKIYDGRVTGIKDFGAFVEILPGRDGLVHISELAAGRVESVTDIVKMGDEVKVLCLDVDEHDRVKLSRRRALEELGLPDEIYAAVSGGRGGNGGGSEDDDDFDGESSGGRGGDRGPRHRRRRPS